MIESSYNINSALISGLNGLQSASEGITKASISIAQQTAQSTLATEGITGVLESAAIQGLETTSNILPQAADNLTSDLVSLQINGINAQAAAEVIDVADETVGRIIDIFA